MPKKEKPPKEKKEKKEKREKKDKKKKENERDKRKMVRISLAICGERRTVESVMNLSGQTMYKTDTYDLVVDMETGTDESGNVIDKSADLYTCVYDVRDKRTVDFLRSNVIPKVQALNQKMAVVGVGLEYRGSREPGIVGQGTTQVFGNAYACPATETILCSGEQFAAGIYGCALNANVSKVTDAEKKEGDKKKRKKEKKEKSTKEKKNKK